MREGAGERERQTQHTVKSGVWKVVRAVGALVQSKERSLRSKCTLKSSWKR